MSQPQAGGQAAAGPQIDPHTGMPIAQPTLQADVNAAVAGHPAFQLAMGSMLLAPTTGGMAYGQGLLKLHQDQVSLTRDKVSLATQLLQSVDPDNPESYSDFVKHMQAMGLDIGNMPPPEQWGPAVKSRLLSNGVTVLQTLEQQNKAWELAIAQHNAQTAEYTAKKPLIEPTATGAIVVGMPKEAGGLPSVQAVPGMIQEMAPSGTAAGGPGRPGQAGTSAAPRLVPYVSQQARQAELQIRGTYDRETEGFEQSMQDYKTLKGALEQKTNPGDKAAVEAFARLASGNTRTSIGMLNAVKEMGTIMDQLKGGLSQHVLGGGQLTQNLRDQMLVVAANAVRSGINRYQDERQRALDEGKSLGLGPQRLAPGKFPGQGKTQWSPEQFQDVLRKKPGHLTPGDIGVHMLNQDIGVSGGGF